MRKAFVHEALLVMEPGADERAPGAAVTVALCGHWEHEPPCPLASHHVQADAAEGELRIRVLFACEPEAEGEARRRIDRALSGRWPFPDGFTTPWQMRKSRQDDVYPTEGERARRLVLG
jgi:hypothetical protein